MTKDELERRAVQRLKYGKEHADKWRKDARDDFAFVAGDQWDTTDEQYLEEAERPKVTFNYSEKMIDAVAGAEVNNRQEAVYKPRGVEDAGANDLYTNAARYVRDQCNADDEESDAFRDNLISGMGWTETVMDYTEHKDGLPVVSRIDPLEMIWDPASSKPSLTDRRWDAWGLWMDSREVRSRWPKAFPLGAESDQAGANEERGTEWHVQPGNRYNDDVNGHSDGPREQDKRTEQTIVYNYICYELEDYYRVDDGQGGIVEMERKEFSPLRSQLDQFGLQYVKSKKKVYYFAYLADDKVMEWGKADCQHGFTRQCMTGKRDRNRNQWYGLTRVMKDPQRWANKWLSQIMHIINSNAKGGLMAETGAFVDPKKAQEEWAKPEGVVLLKEGGIAKVKEKTMSAYPSGLAQLMEFALNSLPQVTGINLEALGLANRDQANVLEQSRKQAAYGLLAPVFDSLKRYRKLQGRVLLYFIREYISDGRLIRISGPGFEQYVPLTKQPDFIEYDVIVDQSPMAPDVKTATWEALMQIVPPMIKAGMPLPPDLLTYAPLPTPLIMKWQKFIEESKKNQMDPAQVQKMREEMQKLVEENQQIKQDKSEKVMDAQTKQKEADFQMKLKAMEFEFEKQLKLMEFQANMQLEGMKTEGTLKLQEKKTDNDLKISQSKAENEVKLATKSQADSTKIKAAQAGLDPKKSEDIRMQLDTTDFANALKEVSSQFADALKQITESMNAPKQVVRDAKGAVVGVKSVDKLGKK